MYPKRRNRFTVNRFRIPTPRRKITKYRRSRLRIPTLSDFSWRNIKSFLKSREGKKKILYASAAGLGFIVLLFGWYAKDLPTPNKINSKFSAQSTQIFDRNGKLLYEIHGDKNRILVKLNDIPIYAQKATIAIEDKDFYSHSGFDVKGILRAVFVDIFTRNKEQGGSTITQQFIKNALLTDEKSFTRKIKEFILAIEIEQMYSKDDILQMYLNEIPYGSNAYGIQVAAKTYFNKDIKDITLEESAVLAALPKAPTYYSPYGQHINELLARKDLVLDRMAAQGYIKKEEAEEAKKKKIAFSGKAYGDISAPHFVMYVKEKLVEKYGEKMVEEGGLKVYTTLDYEKQKIAEEAIAKYADRNANMGASNEALTAIDPKTGQILAMVGSKDFFNQDIDGNVNVAIMPRQPGSSFKPFVYATLFKQTNWGPGSTMYDFTTDFGGGYIPKNYDGADHGIVSARTALGNSLNIPAVKALYIAGIDESLTTAHSMGITDLNDRDKYGLSLVLGAGEVKLVDMANAYGTFANKGIKNDTSWFIKILDSNGKTLEEYKPNKGKQVLDPQIAYLISTMLSDDTARSMVFGMGGDLTLPDRKVAAKTGTTNDYKDAWTIGYTPSLSAGVWVGNNDGTPIKGYGGSMAAAPIWHYFMENALKGTTAEDFQRPSGIKTVTIDAVTGKKPNPSTTSTRTDIFPSWYQITEAGGGVQEIKINKLDGKLASANCPAQIVDVKYINPVNAEIPPEDPAFPRWQAPIAAWAASNGLLTGNGDVPTQTTAMCDNIQKPTVKITSPLEGDNINGKIKVIVKAESAFGIESVTVYLDNASFAANLNGQNWEASITPLKTGLAKIKAEAKDKIGQQNTSQTININIQKLVSQINETLNRVIPVLKED
ncbi:MAG: PBP1A family penicillin-binding protein [Patescibacteria group bacterium]|nr:PBP1A family penicillin-binding protein [Patescibacteria group bacterium]